MKSKRVFNINIVINRDNNFLKKIIKQIDFIFNNRDIIKYKSFPTCWSIFKKMLKAAGILEKQNLDVKKIINLILVISS